MSPIFTQVEVFRFVTQYGVAVGCQHFGWHCCVYLQPQHLGLNLNRRKNLKFCIHHSSYMLCSGNTAGKQPCSHFERNELP